jgi:hypothetical protein
LGRGLNLLLAELDVLLLVKLLLELLSINGGRGVLRRFVCGHGRHFEARNAAHGASSDYCRELPESGKSRAENISN